MAANYNESEKVKRLAEDMALHEAKNPGEWSGGTYGKGMDEALQKVLNRDKFQYDINGDALYQQYKDRYIQQGKQAMMDTVGQAAARQASNPSLSRTQQTVRILSRLMRAMMR